MNSPQILKKSAEFVASKVHHIYTTEQLYKLYRYEVQTKQRYYILKHIERALILSAKEDILYKLNTLR